MIEKKRENISQLSGMFWTLRRLRLTDYVIFVFRLDDRYVYIVEDDESGDGEVFEFEEML